MRLGDENLKKSYLLSLAWKKEFEG